MLRSTPPLHAVSHDDKKTSKKKSMERFSKLFPMRTKAAHADTNLASKPAAPVRYSHLEHPPVRSTSLRSATSELGRVPSQSSTEVPSRQMTRRPCTIPEHEEEQQQQQQQHLEPSSDSLARTASTRSTRGPPHPSNIGKVRALQDEIRRYRQRLDDATRERDHFHAETIRIAEQIDQVQESTRERAEHRSRLTNKVRHQRATGDSVDGIRKKLVMLKESIQSMAAYLVDSCSQRNQSHQTTLYLRSIWSNLESAIKQLEQDTSDGPCLPPHRIRMLTEKFIMDVLMYHLFANPFSGLHDEDDDEYHAYCNLHRWLVCNDPDEQSSSHRSETPKNTPPPAPAVVFSVQLRQELARILASHELLLEDAGQRHYAALFNSIARAFPFVSGEGQLDPQFQESLKTLVRCAMELDLAIKGHEDGIFAARVFEGQFKFDPERMVDEDNQASGTVLFCICPPFIDQSSSIIEKGRVLCTSE